MHRCLIRKTNLTEAQASMLLSLVGNLRVSQVVNPRKGCVMEFPEKHFEANRYHTSAENHDLLRRGSDSGPPGVKTITPSGSSLSVVAGYIYGSMNRAASQRLQTEKAGTLQASLRSRPSLFFGSLRDLGSLILMCPARYHSYSTPKGVLLSIFD